MAGILVQWLGISHDGFAQSVTGTGIISISYTNQRVARVPWSIHAVRVSRNPAAVEIRSTHANAAAVGLTLLSEQVGQVRSKSLKPLAAVNGDFYQRSKAHAGDPRGLQICDGDLFSGPSGGVAFWIDAQSQPHAGTVESQFRVVWPAGSRVSHSAFDVNGERGANELQLYTPAVGRSTRTSGGREFILEPVPGDDSWTKLRIGKTYRARVRELRNAGDSILAPGTFVLSAGPALVRSLPSVRVGDILEVSTASVPDLADARQAIGGGPVLVRNGRRQKIVPPTEDSYEGSSMLERHPRTAIGWNAGEYVLVVVDGRQRPSVGMTLTELGDAMIRLGCTEAVSLDGGGSATLWYAGRIRNSPCDGHERRIANSLVVVERSGALFP
ncbi:MAG: phosphodiester glycosidase family protein [Limisphaerales bacterium]